MMNSMETTRITATLPVSFIDELKALAKSNQIPSVNFAIRQAIDDYLTQARKKQYDAMIQQIRTVSHNRLQNLAGKITDISTQEKILSACREYFDL